MSKKDDAISIVKNHIIKIGQVVNNLLPEGVNFLIVFTDENTNDILAVTGSVDRERMVDAMKQYIDELKYINPEDIEYAEMSLPIPKLTDPN